MLEEVLRQIDADKEMLIDSLAQLIRLPSADGQPTIAQKMVRLEFEKLDLAIYEFKDIDEKAKTAMDYCKPEIEYDENAYNVVGKTKGHCDGPSLLLFAHIDTEPKDYFGHLDDPYLVYRKDGNLYGLGASDDKAGIMMMIAAVRYFRQICPSMPINLTLMSILGKHGGAKGTLSALMKGFRGDYGIYLHPAETGHGFGEIKNISLGVVDLDLIIQGQAAKEHDDLDPGENANVLMSVLITHLERYNISQRDKYRFSFGSFENEPSFILNIGTIEGKSGYGGVCRECGAKIRIRFFRPLTIAAIITDLKDFIAKIQKKDQRLQKGKIIIRQAGFRANPAMVENSDPFVTLVKEEITRISGIKDFIHQYHGGSDIRLPILYGNCKCIGIGPVCHLPLSNSGEMEWIKEDDYINGVKIMTAILYDFTVKFKNSQR